MWGEARFGGDAVFIKDADGPEVSEVRGVVVSEVEAAVGNEPVGVRVGPKGGRDREIF